MIHTKGETNKKNIMIIFMSEMKAGAQTKLYTCPTLQDKVEGTQTNEAPIKYVLQKIGTSQSLDAIYYFQTLQVQKQETKNESTEDYLVRVIKQYCAEKNYGVPRFVPIPYGIQEEQTKEQEKISEKNKKKTIKDNLSQQALNYTFEMVEKIKKDVSIENTNVYVDTTGGFRNTTMVLIAVMRLLQFCGTKMEQVIYSDFNSEEVFDITATYNMYDIISGANEFKLFGRVDTLSKYVNEKEASDSLLKLISAMKQFSEGLQFCKAEGFNHNLVTLREAIKNFKDKNKDTEEEKIFDILNEYIENEYQEIIKENASIPAIIKWCANKEFIQQALTLYVELIPRYLIDEKIIKLVNREKTKEFVESKFKEYEKKYKRWENEFIFHLGKMENTDREKAINDNMTYYDYLRNRRKVELNDDTWKIIETYCKIKNDRNFIHHAEGYSISTDEEKEKIINAVEQIMTLKQ